MTTDQNDDTGTNNNGEGDNQGNGENPDIRQLRKKADRVDTLEKELAEFKTKDAIRQAGLDLNERQIKALLASHEGETTPELLRKTAEELKFVEPEPETDPDVQAAHEKVQAASRGAQVTNPAGYEAEIAAARTKEEVYAIAQKYNKPMEPLV